MNNVKKTRAERPDKALFNVITGVFFIFFALAPAYWALYNYENYRRTTAFVQTLREDNEEFLTPDEKKEKANRISINSSMARRYFLEMSLSGAGCFILVAVALLLFRNALKARKRKNFYEDIDWRGAAMPTSRLEVRYTHFQSVLLGGVIVFFALLTSLNLYQTLTSRFSTTREIFVKGAFSFFIFAIVCLIVFLMIRARRMSVKLFNASGVTRGDGRHFPWTQFQGVIAQTARNRFGRTYVWREELAFSGGETAWLIPNRIKNYDEVFACLAALPRAILKTGR